MTQPLFRDTIFALSSGRLPSGVAIVRLSGPQVRFVLDRMIGSVPLPRVATVSKIFSTDGRLIDHGLVLFFRGPQSFTGEDCAEFHLHGGVATVSACLNSLGSMDGLRAAEAGEFTRRAFMNGKIDLTEAEGLSDLIAAETEAQRVQALLNAEGGQRHLYDGWRKRLIHARAMIEAEIDFSDEDDVPGSIGSVIWTDMDLLAEDITFHVNSAHRAEIVRSGLDVVILGAPNAGKSSLMNALAGRDVSIIAEEAGTTRDLVEVRLDIDGYRVNLVDTAGIRDNPGHVEGIGIQRAQARSANGDLILLVEDVTDGGSAPLPPYGVPCLRVGLKGDLVSGATAVHAYDVVASSLNRAGIDMLFGLLSDFVLKSIGRSSEATPIRQRQVMELNSCLDYLNCALISGDLALELRAEELRLAGDALSRLSGHTDVEDLLDVIFSQFCVGK